MQFGDFYFPLPANEPVLNYAPGSAERLALKKALKELKSEKIDVPMYIGADEIRTGKIPTNTAEFDEAEQRVKDSIHKFITNNGTKSVDSFHKKNGTIYYFYLHCLI